MLDDLDRLIVGALHVNPRATWDAIATIAEVDASTVSRRVTRLEHQRLLRIRGEVAWRLYSSTLPVHLRLQVSGAPPAAVADELSAIGSIQHLSLTYGRFPLFATLHAASEEQTGTELRALYDVPGVLSISTQPVLTYARKGSSWDPQLLTQDERERCARHLCDPSIDSRGSALNAPGSPDAVEKAALALLQRHARVTATQLGRALGVSPSSANRLLRRVLTNGWLTPRVEIDGSFLGYHAPFILRAKTSHQSAAEVSFLLARHPSTRFVTQVTSEFNLICTGIARDRTHLASLINDEFAALPGIRDLDVDLCIRDCKRFWTRRDPQQLLGDFAPPPQL